MNSFEKTSILHQRKVPPPKNSRIRFYDFIGGSYATISIFITFLARNEHVALIYENGAMSVTTDVFHSYQICRCNITAPK
jgi:hypothetical protein